MEAAFSGRLLGLAEIGLKSLELGHKAREVVSVAELTAMVAFATFLLPARLTKSARLSPKAVHRSAMSVAIGSLSMTGILSWLDHTPRAQFQACEF
ncbi:MAG: hypothetical protein ACLPKB_06745 [Xanthobacteraceae bacterium]